MRIALLVLLLCGCKTGQQNIEKSTFYNPIGEARHHVSRAERHIDSAIKKAPQEQLNKSEPLKWFVILTSITLVLTFGVTTCVVAAKKIISHIKLKKNDNTRTD